MGVTLLHSNRISRSFWDNNFTKKLERTSYFLGPASAGSSGTWRGIGITKRVKKHFLWLVNPPPPTYPDPEIRPFKAPLDFLSVLSNPYFGGGYVEGGYVDQPKHLKSLQNMGWKLYIHLCNGEFNKQLDIDGSSCQKTYLRIIAVKNYQYFWVSITKFQKLGIQLRSLSRWDARLSQPWPSPAIALLHPIVHHRCPANHSAWVG